MTKKITLGEEIEQNISSSCFIGLFIDIVNFYNAKLNQSTFIVEKSIG